MSDRTRIEWATATWNPMTGCTPVSEACEHCYAERMARRFKPCAACEENWRDQCNACEPEHYFYPTFHPDRLDKPLHWRKPRRIFVCSMSDLFHEAFSYEQVRDVLDVAIRAPQHVYMLLTKRPELMAPLVQRYYEQTQGGPLPNVWAGTTAENQQRADERIPILLDTPAAVRFVSVEPMLSKVDLTNLHTGPDTRLDALQAYAAERAGIATWDNYPTLGPSLDWVILGGETGPGARPMQPEWALDVYRQCKTAGVPFFWKREGSAFPGAPSIDPGDWYPMLFSRELPEGVAS